MKATFLDTPDQDDIDFGEMRGSLGLLLRLAQVKVFDSFFENLSKHGLKPGEFTMLWVIGLNPDTKQGLVARRLRIKPAHMTKLVQRNVDKGLVEFSISAPEPTRGGRSRKHCALTRAGKGALEHSTEMLTRMMQGAVTVGRQAP